ncbi:hypothetical protein O9K51_06489 [Purpureocillium lavendulum]|uniref:Uncharacterized protein n=1 Tax=Purpureocillium lavendulum TaxID=1247861 RepID=A0AB34FNN4_9HYPO|nr:hypothetical protein O9K51_06489 [Purpureocillium lavendulum]
MAPVWALRGMLRPQSAKFLLPVAALRIGRLQGRGPDVFGIIVTMPSAVTTDVGCNEGNSIASVLNWDMQCREIAQSDMIHR